ncbi:hypothetical protein XI04_08515 [Bradyrhizobium sp. CCBAU 11430]|nr:hypothetical protein [Bradyrhizobium sp. CCBAU 11430]
MLAETFGMDRIKFGYEVVSIENNADKVVCHFSNGESYEGDVIIGADGIYSTVREQLIGAVPFRQNDHHAYRYRAVINLSDVDVDPAAQTTFCSPGGWMAVIPVGNGKAYWFGSVFGVKNLDEFIQFFSSWTRTHIPRTLSITPRDTIVESPLYDVDIPYKWTHGRVTLIGDAAHPMMPDLAQGASQTFIDALALREAFAKTNNADEALHAYESQRRPVAYHVVKCSQKGGFLGKNKVDPVAVRYEREVEASTAASL